MKILNNYILPRLYRLEQKKDNENNIVLCAYADTYVLYYKGCN